MATRYDLGTPVDRTAQFPQGQMRMTPWGPLQWLAPGLFGIVRMEGADLVLYWIETADEGRGHASRYLDRLPLDRTVVAAAVVNPRVVDMLVRRGFRQMEGADDWHRPPS